MIKMIKCEALVKALNGNYKGSYYDFEKEIIKFVERYMFVLFKDVSYIPVCLIKENLSVDGVAVFPNKIFINKKVVKSLMNGEKLYLVVLFHELTHIQQYLQIKNGISTPNIIRYIKDNLLNEYQEKENKCFSKFYTDKIFNFYHINYKNESSEIDANLNALLLMEQFFYENNIDYINEKEFIDNYFNNLIERKSKKRNLTYCISFNSYYLTLDDAFDAAIKYHPEWLDRYPQLRVEYELNNGLVVKKSKVIYQGYDKSSDIYHKIKYLIK